MPHLPTKTLRASHLGADVMIEAHIMQLHAEEGCICANHSACRDSSRVEIFDVTPPSLQCSGIENMSESVCTCHKAPN